MSCHSSCYPFHVVFSFTDLPTTAIYTLSLHDALPISAEAGVGVVGLGARADDVVAAVGEQRRLVADVAALAREQPDRKSTRLNSSHLGISYAVFCLKKKKY